MIRRIGMPLVAAMLLGWVAAPALAKTVTFNKLPDYASVIASGGNGGPYREMGIIVNPTTGILASDTTPGAAHIDDAGTDFTSGLMFTTNRPFSALSFSLIALGYDWFDRPRRLADNIIVTGYAGGAVVALAKFTMSDDLFKNQTLKLGAAFAGLDALLIELVYPTRGVCGSPCAHFELDQVELAAVPLPATLPLLAAAGLGLWGLGRRRAA